MSSGFGSLNWADLGKGILVAFGTVFLGAIYTAIQGGALPTSAQLGAWALSGVAAAIAYLLKNLFTSSDNKLLGKEPPQS